MLEELTNVRCVQMVCIREVSLLKGTNHIFDDLYVHLRPIRRQISTVLACMTLVYVSMLLGVQGFFAQRVVVSKIEKKSSNAGCYDTIFLDHLTRFNVRCTVWTLA
jgi:hypothetical protein